MPVFPIALDLSVVRLALVGNGVHIAKRLAQLDEAGAANLTVYAPDPGTGLADAAGDRLVRALPDARDLAGLHLVWIADLPGEDQTRLAGLARQLGTLVNVEDVLPLCDIHTPSMVKRGDLVIGISTGGASPALARRLRRHLERLFPAEWADRVQRIAAARLRWRAEGADMATVTQRTDRLITENGWLP